VQKAQAYVDRQTGRWQTLIVFPFSNKERIAVERSVPFADSRRIPFFILFPFADRFVKLEL
jgi:hypothetical protein